MRTVRPLTRTSEEKLVNMLKRMQHFYNVHGINLRTTYEDFDKHHMGIVTESQVMQPLISFRFFCLFVTMYHIHKLGTGIEMQSGAVKMW